MSILLPLPQQPLATWNLFLACIYLFWASGIFCFLGWLILQCALPGIACPRLSNMAFTMVCCPPRVCVLKFNPHYETLNRWTSDWTHCVIHSSTALRLSPLLTTESYQLQTFQRLWGHVFLMALRTRPGVELWGDGDSKPAGLSFKMTAPFCTPPALQEAPISPYHQHSCFPLWCGF
jgi:hypothetical protein